MQYKKIICKYCGRSAVVPTLRKANYCNNCRGLAHNEVSRAYYQKNISKNEIMMRNKNHAVPVRTVSVEGANNMYEKELDEISEEYDKLRLKTIKLLQKAQAQEERLTKSGDILVHKLEFENLTDSEKLKMADIVARDRKLRRGWKLTKQTAYGLVSSFELRSATKYVAEAKKGARSTRDFKGYLESLKSNNEIYVDNMKSKTKGE